MNLKVARNAFLNIIYPKSLFCINCGETLKPGSEHGFCQQCIESLPFVHGKSCGKCGRPVESTGADNYSCLDCSSTKRYFDSTISVFEYTGIIQELIYKFKYYGEFSLSSSFGSFMTDKLRTKTRWNIDAVLPVPLHPNRKSNRGYNQSELLAAYISDSTGISCLTDTLIRIKDTPSQTKLSKKERMENLEDAFKITTPVKIKSKNVLLVDDVMTSGATINYCSRELKKAGASDIYAITLATVPISIE